MKHYISKTMLQKKIEQKRQEIKLFEQKYYYINNTKKNDPKIAKLRCELHELKTLLSLRTHTTILRNGKK
jgi:hypothetical protein